MVDDPDPVGKPIRLIEVLRGQQHLVPALTRSRISALPRGQRREQIIAAATRAFAKAGFAATSLDDIAAEARISRAILYRHFDSKTDLCQAVLDNACGRLINETGADQFTDESIGGLLRAAAADPAGFHLLFHHAAREPEFRQAMDQFRTDMTLVAHKHLAAQIPDPA